MIRWGVWKNGVSRPERCVPAARHPSLRLPFFFLSGMMRGGRGQGQGGTTTLAHTSHANPPSMSTNVAERDPLRAADEVSFAGRTGKACAQKGAFRHW